MRMPEFDVIDLGEFPLALIHSSDLVPGDGPRMIEDLEKLIELAEPFVLVIVNGDKAPESQHEEDKARMLWLKENRTRLATVCKGIVSVMPNSQDQSLVHRQAAGLQAMLGIPFLVTADLSDGKTKAGSLVQNTATGVD